MMLSECPDLWGIVLLPTEENHLHRQTMSQTPRKTTPFSRNFSNFLLGKYKFHKHLTLYPIKPLHSHFHSCCLFHNNREASVQTPGIANQESTTSESISASQGMEEIRNPLHTHKTVLFYLREMYPEYMLNQHGNYHVPQQGNRIGDQSKKNHSAKRQKRFSNLSLSQKREVFRSIMQKHEQNSSPTSKLYPNSQEKLLLCNYLGIGVLELTQLLNDARKWTNATSLMRRRTESSSDGTNGEESLDDAQSTNTRSRVTEEKKRLIRECLQNYNWGTLPTDQLLQLKEQTQLSKTQLYNQISLIRDEEQLKQKRTHHANNPSQHDSSSNKSRVQIISEYLDERNDRLASPLDKASPRFWHLSSQEMIALRDKIGITRTVLRGILRTMKDQHAQGTITNHAKEMVHNWMHENDITSVPAKWKLEEISKRSNLSKEQIRGIITRKLDPPSRLTREKKLIVKEYLEGLMEGEENMTDDDQGRDYSSSMHARESSDTTSLESAENSVRAPSRVPALVPTDLDILQERTKLSRQQLHNLIKRWRMDAESGKNPVTEEHRNRVQSVLQSRSTSSSLTSTEYTQLSEELNLSRQQVIHLVWRERHRRVQ